MNVDHINHLSPLQTRANWIGERLHAAIIAGNHGLDYSHYEAQAREHLAELAEMMGFTLVPVNTHPAPRPDTLPDFSEAAQ